MAQVIVTANLNCQAIQDMKWRALCDARASEAVSHPQDHASQSGLIMDVPDEDSTQTSDVDL